MEFMNNLLTRKEEQMLLVETNYISFLINDENGIYQ